MANAAVNAKKQANPDMTRSEIKKLSQQELTKARATVGAKRETIKINDREWEAIQAGAISENKLMQILNNVDIDDLRQRATPKTTTSLSTAKINRISSMKASGYTTKDIANALGVSTSTVLKYLKGKE
jgi:DNA-binding NarL/FixJ family response regulator